MKLYFAPGACSLAPHIVLREAGLDFELERVDLATHRTESGTDFYHINSRGQVPVLLLEDGQVLTEGSVIARFLVDKAPDCGLLPPPGSLDHYRVQEWQNYIASELHKSYTPLFNSSLDDQAKALFRKILRRKYEWLNTQLADRDYLSGQHFTVADAYLFVVTRWAPRVAVDLTDLVEIEHFMQRVRVRPSVVEALAAEGLSP